MTLCTYYSTSREKSCVLPDGHTGAHSFFRLGERDADYEDYCVACDGPCRCEAGPDTQGDAVDAMCWMLNNAPPWVCHRLAEVMKKYKAEMPDNTNDPEKD